MSGLTVEAYSCPRCGDAILRWHDGGDWQTGYIDASVDLDEGSVTAHAHECAGRPPSEFPTKDDAAQWLAQVCGSPRYGESGYGWRSLLEVEANATHAAALARQRLADDSAALRRLSEAKRVLGLT